MPALKIITLYPDIGDDKAELIQQYVDLGWVVQGRLNDESINPRKGKVVHLTLGWASDKEPLYPESDAPTSL